MKFFHAIKSFHVRGIEPETPHLGAQPAVPPNLVGIFKACKKKNYFVFLTWDLQEKIKDKEGF